MTLDPTLLPSTWFSWHEHLIRPGTRVLDLACGAGRHALRAARRGARVTAVDRDPARLARGREAAAAAGLDIAWQEADLAAPWPAFGVFDVVLLFDYLDRDRMPQLRALVAPRGFLVAETFLVTQRTLGWGPASDEHLLRAGELASLVQPFEVVHGREVLEPVGTDRWRAVASIVATPRP